MYLPPPSLSSSTCLILKSFHAVHYPICNIYIFLSVTLFVVADLKEQNIVCGCRPEGAAEEGVGAGGGRAQRLLQRVRQTTARAGRGTTQR